MKRKADSPHVGTEKLLRELLMPFLANKDEETRGRLVAAMVRYTADTLQFVK
jgi:hypothetical protein